MVSVLQLCAQLPLGEANGFSQGGRSLETSDEKPLAGDHTAAKSRLPLLDLSDV